MPSQSKLHDHAFAISKCILEVFEPLLREDEQRDAFREVYDRVKAGIEHYETSMDRLTRRLRPGIN